MYISEITQIINYKCKKMNYIKFLFIIIFISTLFAHDDDHDSHRHDKGKTTAYRYDPFPIS